FKINANMARGVAPGEFNHSKSNFTNQSKVREQPNAVYNLDIKIYISIHLRQSLWYRAIAHPALYDNFIPDFVVFSS
ncbi:MAG: hypothetical protein ACI3X2_07300, partial [Butyricicoccus porcorum]